MNPLDASAHLEHLLAQRGVLLMQRDWQREGPGEHALTAWDAFCCMVVQPSDRPFDRNGLKLVVGEYVDCDLLLHESYAAKPDGRFVLAFARQFSFVDMHGDYAGMNALRLHIEVDGCLPDELRRRSALAITFVPSTASTPVPTRPASAHNAST